MIGPSMKQIFRSICGSAALLVFAASCAHEVPPQGGPVDTIPPVLKGAVPPSGALNHRVKDPIRFNLSEWDDPAAAKKNIAVYPMPEGGVEVKAVANHVTVKPLKAFADSTTYQISVPDGFTDIHGVSPKTAYNYYFSTGPVMDSGTLSGAIAGADRKSVV